MLNSHYCNFNKSVLLNFEKSTFLLFPLYLVNLLINFTGKIVYIFNKLGLGREELFHSITDREDCVLNLKDVKIFNKWRLRKEELFHSITDN